MNKHLICLAQIMSYGGAISIVIRRARHSLHWKKITVLFEPQPWNRVIENAFVLITVSLNTKTKRNSRLLPPSGYNCAAVRPRSPCPFIVR